MCVHGFVIYRETSSGMSADLVQTSVLPGDRILSTESHHF